MRKNKRSSRASRNRNRKQKTEVETENRKQKAESEEWRVESREQIGRQKTTWASSKSFPFITSSVPCAYTQGGGVSSLCGWMTVCVCVCACVGWCSIEMSVYILLSYLLRMCGQNFKCAVMKLLPTNAVNTRSHTHTLTHTHSYAHWDRQSRHHFMAWFRQRQLSGILLILQTPQQSQKVVRLKCYAPNNKKLC